MQSGWVAFAVLVAFMSGALLAFEVGDMRAKQSARSGVVVIDGSLYVLLPAKRGGE